MLLTLLIAKSTESKLERIWIMIGECKEEEDDANLMLESSAATATIWTIK